MIWTGRPYPGLAWRPHDLPSTLLPALVAGVALTAGIAYGEGMIFFIVVMLFSGYLLAGRFYHDAWLRRRLRYELSEAGLTIWVEGGDAPECEFPLLQLRNVRPQFTTRSGRGTIELPPGGWAAQPFWMNRWDRYVPAIYSCRRLELIEDVEAVAEMIRRAARAALDEPRRAIALRAAAGVRDRPDRPGAERPPGQCPDAKR